jgi:mannitol/fructose-specific phosphotransferase system IIA component (Ntr-type)
MPNPRLILSEMLTPATIVLRMQSRQREEALAELVAVIPEIADRPDARQTLLQALKDREQLHSTGIGDGVALPHARNGLVGLVQRPVIVFGRHETGVPFGAIDGEPTKLFFLLVAPSVTEHLSILARVSRLMRDSRLRQSLLLAETPQKVIDLIHQAELAM